MDMPSLADTVAALNRYQRSWTQTPDLQDHGFPEQGLLGDVTAFGSNPGALRMRVYRPAHLPKQAPLVVVLHGCRQTAEAYAVGAGWLSLADRFGFAVLCPEQVSANNAFGCFNWFEPGDTARDHGEAASIRQMIDRMLTDARLDRKRVFVTGLSAGGAMTNVMLATYPEVFAGGAPIAGLPYGSASDGREALTAMFQGVRHSPQVWGDKVRRASTHGGPWPKVSVWQGDADTTVRPANGEAVAQQWADVHGLPALPGATRQDGPVQHSVWLDGRGAPVVERFEIQGLGHGTPLATREPDGCGVVGPFLLEAGVSSSFQIAQFWGIADLVHEAAPKPAHSDPLKASAGAAPKPHFGMPFPSSTPHAQNLKVGRALNSVLRAIGLRR
jgi:poly(hydroxyalkanoate) depolymerase family esterase